MRDTAPGDKYTTEFTCRSTTVAVTPSIGVTVEEGGAYTCVGHVNSPVKRLLALPAEGSLALLTGRSLIATSERSLALPTGRLLLLSCGLLEVVSTPDREVCELCIRGS